MSWRVLYIEESDLLSLYLDNIKIRHKDEEITIPISDVNTIILDNYKINISVHLINALTKNNVNFVICGIDHLPQTIVLPHHGNKLGYQMLNKQLGWSNELKGKIQEFIIKNKIINQNSHLKYHKKNEVVVNTINTFLIEVLAGDSGNREGLSAKMYFKELFGKEFVRFNEDVVNAGLNYGYAILRSQISKVLVSKGLNTAIGFFHIGRENEFNLSDDIIEPFRPIIDKYVYDNLLEEQIFKKEHRHNLVKQTTKTVIINRQKQTIFNAIQIYIEAILRYCETNDENDFLEVELNYDEL